MSFQSVALSFQSVLLCGRTAWRGFQTSDKRSKKKKKKGVKEVVQFYIYKLPIDRPWRLLLVIIIIIITTIKVNHKGNNKGKKYW